MSNRIINLNIADTYISAIGGSIGATGSGNATTLRMTFDEHWDGTTKTVYFKDANGENPVSVTLGLDDLEYGTENTYDVSIPGEPLAISGMASMTVKGVVVSGETTTRSITTQAAQFRVLDADIPVSAGNAGTITPSDKEQLQSEIDALTAIFTTNRSAAESASETAVASAADAADSATDSNHAKMAAETARDTALQAKCDAIAAREIADASVSKSAASASIAESWAVGGTNTRLGENENNSMYYSQISRTAMQAAEESKIAADASEEVSRSQAQLSMTAREHAESIADEVRGNAALAVERSESALASFRNAQQAANVADSRASLASQHANSATASASAAAEAAAEAQAAVERAKIPAAVGVYNVILADRETGARYALIAENGVLNLLEVASDLDAAVVTLIDANSGTAYELISESGILKLKEV